MSKMNQKNKSYGFYAFLSVSLMTTAIGCGSGFKLAGSNDNGAGDTKSDTSQTAPGGNEGSSNSGENKLSVNDVKSVVQGMTSLMSNSNQFLGSGSSAFGVSGTTSSKATLAGSSAPSIPSGACTKLPTQQTCQSGVQEADYSNCSVAIGQINLSYNGWVRLTYSQPSCSFQSGDEIQVETDFNISGKLSSKELDLTISSKQHNDFQGQSIGGGAVVKKTGDLNYELDIPGIRIVDAINQTPSGNPLDISIYTLGESKKITAMIDMQNKKAEVDGSVNISINSEKVAVSIDADHVSYDGNKCCIPISGRIDAKTSNNDSASVVFLSTCGQVDITVNGQKKTETITCK